MESALSEDSRLSAGTTSQGEPEGLLAEAEGLGQQEAAPAAQDEDAEESYEEVRLAAEGAFQEAGAAHPSPSLSFQAHAQSGPVGACGPPSWRTQRGSRQEWSGW